MIFTYIGHVTAKQCNVPAASNAAGPARNTVEARYSSSLKQRSSQVSCLMLNFLMYGVLPCYSVLEQILLYNTITRYNTVGQGQRWEEEEAVPCPAQTIAQGLGRFCKAPFPLSLFYSCTYAKELSQF